MKENIYSNITTEGLDGGFENHYSLKYLPLNHSLIKDIVTKIKAAYLRKFWLNP